MHRGFVGLATMVLVLLAGACSGSSDADETEAVATAQPAAPAQAAEQDEEVGAFAPTVEQTESTSEVTEDNSETTEATSTPETAPPETAPDPAAPAPDPSDESVDDPSYESAVELNIQRIGPDGVPAARIFDLVPVEQGDNGDGVLALQKRLGKFGFAPGTPDGSYGRRTIAAVEAFQELVGLDVTGDADAETIGALIKYRYDGLLLYSGDEGDAVETLQLRLSDGPFDPGPIDGAYGAGTKQAVWALEKIAGIPVDGDWGPLDENAWQQLMDGEIGTPEKEHETRWVEVDLSEQVMKVYDPGSSTPVLISHASSGSGIPWSNEEYSGSSVTPRGDFTISRRISGWRESSLNIGRLYNPLYFNGGIAFHGATSVPLYPASHGCIRLPMHVAEYLPGELPNGTPVHVLS